METLPPGLRGGYSQISNEILESIMYADLTKREYKICLCILRYGYGYKKEKSEIICHQRTIAKLTGLNEVVMKNILSLLDNKNIIKYDKLNKTLSFNRHTTTWKLNKTLSIKERELNKTLSKNLIKHKVHTKQNVKLDSLNPSSIKKQRDPKERVKKIDKERTSILSQINNLISQFPSNLQSLINEYTDIARLQNKTEKISLYRQKRLIDELLLVWQQYQGNDIDESDYYKALKITINNQAPNINYVRKVIQGIVNKRSIRMKRGTISS